MYLLIFPKLNVMSFGEMQYKYRLYAQFYHSTALVLSAV